MKKRKDKVNQIKEPSGFIFLFYFTFAKKRKLLGGIAGNHKGLDEKGFELLFREHFKPMVFFAIKYVKDYDTAKEIAHDAFISLWENRADIDPARSVKSWLSTTIYNRCLNFLRDNKKFDRNILEFEHLSELSVSASDKMISEETHEYIFTVIDELPDKCREIFMLSRFEELKYQEIAVKLGISVKTVETQISKALQHMRTRLLPFLKIMLTLILYKCIL